MLIYSRKKTNSGLFSNSDTQTPFSPPLLEYIRKEWLNDCLKRFLHYYTSQYLYLNKIATSYTKGAHWLLKQDLQVSTNDLLVVLRNFTRAVQLQFSKVQQDIQDIEKQKIHQPAEEISWLYRLLYTWISVRAIQLTKELHV
jgi:dimeric dUTPase (all-alpha-NTP-PPase superfamily)